MADVRRLTSVGRPVEASVAVPGSKSIANRALVCAALADGLSVVRGVPDGDDTVAMVGCLRALGVDVDHEGDRVGVASAGPEWRRTTLHAGLAGTTSRFVTALAALGRVPIVVDGHAPLRRRPFGPLLDALVQLGVGVEPGESFGHLPTTITGPPTGRTASLPGDVSSQFVSALMMIGPLLPDGLDLGLTSPLVSRPYVELTAAVMGWFGATDVTVGDDRIRVGEQRYSPADVAVEPDASSAGYPLALAALTGGTVTIEGLGTGALQGDAAFADILADMGCAVDRDDRSTTVRGTDRLTGIDIDMAAVSDLVPTVAIVAACAVSPTRIRGVGFIREKESDRLGDLASEMRSVGALVEVTDDGLAIEPSRDRMHGARVRTHHDHRLAMAFAVLSAVVDGIEIADPGVVTKSWPGFWDAFETWIR